MTDIITITREEVLLLIPGNKVDKNYEKVGNIKLLKQIKVDKEYIEQNILPTLKPDVIEFIKVEKLKDELSKKYNLASRDERDEKVVVHLVLKGYEKYIKSIFDLYPIGNKMREHPAPDKYLEYAIRNGKIHSGVDEDFIIELETELYKLPKNVLKNKINIYLKKVSEISDELQRIPLLEIIKDKTKISLKDLKERLNKLVYEEVEEEVYSLRDLMTNRYEKEAAYIENFLLKNSITLIAGKSGRFKTMLALLIALSLTSGQKLLNEFTVKESPKILYYDLDANGKSKFYWRTKYLMSGMKLNEEIFDRLKITHGFLADSPEKEVEKANEYDIIILDSYRRFFKGDENKSETTNKFFKDYLEKLKKLGKTVIVLLHFKKANFEDFEDDDFIDAARGSSDIVSQADVYYCLIKSEDEVDPTTKNRKFTVSIIAPKDRDGSVANKFSFHVFKNVVEEKTELTFLGYKKVKPRTSRNREVILDVINTELRIKRTLLLTKVKEKIENISTITIDRILKDLVDEELIDNKEFGYYKVNNYKNSSSSTSTLNDFSK